MAAKLTDEQQRALDDKYMALALRKAREAARDGEVPIGAVIIRNGAVIGEGRNMTEALGDVTAHAEMLAITSAANGQDGKYLTDCTLYVTVEPCLMCAGAIAWSQLRRIVIGAQDTKRGYRTYMRAGEGSDCVSPFHPKAEVIYGVRGDECAALVRDFFRQKR